MTKSKYLTMLLMVAVILGFTGCSDDDEPQMPQFGAITISPEKTCTKWAMKWYAPLR